LRVRATGTSIVSLVLFVALWGIGSGLGPASPTCAPHLPA